MLIIRDHKGPGFGSATGQNFMRSGTADYLSLVRDTIRSGPFCTCFIRFSGSWQDVRLFD